MKRHQVKEIWIKNRKHGAVIVFLKYNLNVISSRSKDYHTEDITRSSLKRIEAIVQTAHETRLFLGKFFQQQHYTFYPWKM